MSFHDNVVNTRIRGPYRVTPCWAISPSVCHSMSLCVTTGQCQDSVTWCMCVSLCAGMVSTGPRGTYVLMKWCDAVTRALYLPVHQHILDTELCGGLSNTASVFVSYKTNTLSQTTHDTATLWSLCHRWWLLQNSNGPFAAHQVYSKCWSSFYLW